MKGKIFIILIAGMLVGAAAMYFLLPVVRATESGALEAEKQLYSCGMHPEVISDKPGNCPICGMKLTPIKSTGQEAGQSGVAGKERKVLYWRAPMDPTEIYAKPGKSKMGMDLVPVYEGDEAGGAGSITIDGALQQNMNLRTVPVSRKDLSRVIRALGKVTYAEDKEFSVNTKISGWVEKLYVNTTGQKVRRGQPLLEIYSPELVSTQEEYLLALKNYEKLSASPYASIRENAKKMLGIARERLEYWDISPAEIEKIKKTSQSRRTILLKSQTSGIVTHKAVVAGDKVGPGMDLFHIADLNTIWIEASVYESELPLVKVGQKAELELDHVPGQKLEGKVDFIYPYLDRKSRANNVRFVFANTDFLLKPDMDVTVRIYSHAAQDSLVIPSEAVIHSGKRKIVFVTKGDGKFEPREVKLGTESDDGFYEIVSGLFEDELVVVSGQFLLDSESQTREAIAKMRAAQAQSKPGAAPDAEEAMEHIHTHEEEAVESYEGHTETEPKAAIEQTHTHKTEASTEPHAGHIDIDKLYTCPMHPEFITSDPESKCPECGMNLIPVKELKDKVDLEKAEFYTCPMHPEFLTTDKNARCPECGMKLEKVKKKK